VGKMGKYYKKYLSEELYEMYLKTYSDGNYQTIWTAVFTACELFHTLAVNVADHFGYLYHLQEEKAMLCYLNGIKQNSKK
jgi:Streptomycin adenylyltransferase.